MKSLFEKEEKELSINQLKLDLISRFYPFRNEEILKYKSILNFDQYHLMHNDSVKWDFDLIDELEAKLDWSELWKIRNIKFDLAFFKKYESKIDFTSIHLSKNIDWSDDLLSEFGDRFDWSKWLITKKPLATVENLRRYKNVIDWSLVSNGINIDFTEEIIQEFFDKWDWKKLSANHNLPLSFDFILKYMEQLDFDAISQNPKSIELIYKYPNSKKWNWDKVILNPAIHYTKDSFEFVFLHFKRQYEAKAFVNPHLKKMALQAFLFSVFARQRNDKSYFLQDDFIKYLPWGNMCKFCNTKLSLDFIEKYKDKLNFKEAAFISIHRDIISREFIESNIDLFDPSSPSFYYLPLTIELLNKLDDKIYWNMLSRMEQLDWTWEYIDLHFDKFNLLGLSENRGIYNKLVIQELTDVGVLKYLDKEMEKKTYLR